MSPEESHAVPVDLVTVTRVDQCRGEAPPPPPTPHKIEVPVPQMEAPALPQFKMSSPRPCRRCRNSRSSPRRRPSSKIPRPSKSRTARISPRCSNKLTAPGQAPPNAKVGPRTIQGIGAANAMTADLADALKSQIYHCWSPPVGAPNANDLVVDFDLRLNPDGTVASANSAALSNANRQSLYPRRRRSGEPCHLSMPAL